MRGYNLGNMRLDIEIDRKRGTHKRYRPDWVIENVPTLRRNYVRFSLTNKEESIFQAGINKESVNLLLRILESTEQKKQLKDALGKLDNDENLLTREDSEDTA